MNAAQQKQVWGQIVAKAWADEAFKRLLLAEPAAVLKEHKIEVPPGVRIRVVEDTDQVRHLTLPVRPAGELSEQELAAVAGGGGGWWEGGIKGT
jgi:hypothetical protein